MMDFKSDRLLGYIDLPMQKIIKSIIGCRQWQVSRQQPLVNPAQTFPKASTSHSNPIFSCSSRI